MTPQWGSKQQAAPLSFGRAAPLLCVWGYCFFQVPQRLVSKS